MKAGENSLPALETVERDLSFTHGCCPGRVCEIIVDGAWKKVKGAFGSRAIIGWTTKENSETVFKGNAIVKANSALQAEGLAVLKGLEEAYANRIVRVKILTDSTKLVQELQKASSQSHIASICQDIYKVCKLFSFCEIIKVDGIGSETVTI